MTLALTEDHRALSDVARAFLADRGAITAARGLLETKEEALPQFWAEMAAMGWLGLHLPESFGGQGYALSDLAIVVEELGRGAAPGPFLPTVWASAVIDAAADDAVRAALLPVLASGEQIAAVGLGAGLSVDGSGGLVHGDAGPVLGAGLAGILVLQAGDDVVVVARDAAGVDVTACGNLDPTRRVALVTCDDVQPIAILRGAATTARRLGRTLAAAEAAGGAGACTEMAVAYAKQREQFGRTIGTFQAVKHHCANMLVDTELAAAVAWDAARTVDPAGTAELVAALATTLALPAYQRCAERNIQIHGGIGYTWEHDAHLYLRRASALAALFEVDRVAREVVAMVDEGHRPQLSVDLPETADAHRAEAQAFRARHDALPDGQRRAALIESGYLVPHWPRPWGRGADAAEQLIIEQELAGVEQPELGIGTWVLLTLVQHGTPDQLERWIRPSLDGQLVWCQLFSEPNAGSDVAAIQTRATRTDGGWLLNGQKVWTSDAHNAHWGLATVRTDPDAPKHAGVTMVAVDMHAKGVEVRPLRELTGENMFNEVFFDDVFISDDDVVGEVDNGWKVARATLGNERVSIGANKSNLVSVDAWGLPALAVRSAEDGRSAEDARSTSADATPWSDVAGAVAEAHGMSALNLRHIVRALSGAGPGPEGNVSKLLSAEHAQRVAGVGLRLLGPAAAADDETGIAHDYFFTRCLSIAGGTSEVVRNQIAERILGLPRDPLQR